MVVCVGSCIIFVFCRGVANLFFLAVISDVTFFWFREYLSVVLYLGLLVLPLIVC